MDLSAAGRLTGQAEATEATEAEAIQEEEEQEEEEILLNQSDK